MMTGVPAGFFVLLALPVGGTHTKARLMTYPVRGLHYGPTLKVVTLDRHLRLLNGRLTLSPASGRHLLTGRLGSYRLPL